MVVVVPVADVRAKPIPHNKKYENDPLQETQVEEGEPVLVHQKKGNWYFIEAPEQMEYTHNNRWEGYPGWVEKKALSLDANQHHKLELLSIDDEALRQSILEMASLHFGHPYLWGGRSFHNSKNKSVVTGVDCSGLINWSYRRVGWFVPRDAHEQFMKAKQIGLNDLKSADLIFLAEVNKPEKIVHVALYAGRDDLIEAPQTGEQVRRISGLKRFGKPLKSIKNGEKIKDRIVYFGSFFD